MFFQTCNSQLNPALEPLFGDASIKHVVTFVKRLKPWKPLGTSSRLLRLRRNGINAYLETPEKKRKNRRYPKRVWIFTRNLGGTLRFLSLRFSWRIITFFFYAMAFHWQIFGIDMMDYLCSCSYGYIWPTHGFEKEQGKIATKILFQFHHSRKISRKTKDEGFQRSFAFQPIAKENQICE